MEIRQQQSARLASDSRHDGKKRFGSSGNRHFGTLDLGPRTLVIQISCVPTKQLTTGPSSEAGARARGPRSGVRGPLYFRLPPSSMMYIISCLKMNRLGALSRVNRTIFLS